MANQWGAYYLLSIHINAGGGTGFESYTFNGRYNQKSTTNHLRSIIHDEIVEQSDFRDRGEKEANFHMLRESKMSAVLTENGFIDSNSDAKKLKSDAFLNKIARSHAVGVAKALGLSKKLEGSTLYRVVAGSFKKRSNADDHADALAANQFDSFIAPTELNGVTYYRVIAGSFREKDNAERRIIQLTQADFDSFIIRMQS